MNPKPFSALNHFTVPFSSTAIPEDDPFDVVAPKFDRRGGAGIAVLVSTLRTSVTCDPCGRGRPNFEGFTRLHCVDAALSHHAPMEEGVARPIREFDKSKPFSGLNT